MPARIVVADDHDVVRAGVRTILQGRPDWMVCGEAADGQEALAQVKSLNPDVVVLDISMPSLNGLEAAIKMRQSGCDTPILIFTMHDSGSVVRAAQEAGANGLVVKSFASRDLIRAVEALLAGETFFGADESKELTRTAEVG
jgi:DNA-binding NarL/FixJ family response regulator